MSISLNTYRGEAPRVSKRALPNDMAQSAINCRLLSGDLEAWQDIKDIFSLVKPGPTNTMALMANKYWLNWSQSEIAAGFTNVDVARVPVVNDNSFLTVFTGTGAPRITNLAMAVGGNTNPNGLYPLASESLGLSPPQSAPLALNATAAQNPIVTTTNYISDFSTWATGVNGGAYGKWSVIAIQPGSGSRPAMPGPYFQGEYQSPHSDYAQTPQSFDLADCIVFALDIDIGGDVSNTDQHPNGYLTILAGNQIGGRLNLNFRDGNNITWQDQAGGGPTIQIGPNNIVHQNTAVHVRFDVVNKGGNSNGIRTFGVMVKVFNYGTNTLIASSQNLTCTYGGENIVGGGFGGTDDDVQRIYLARVGLSVTQPAPLVVPVFSNYVDTVANSLGFESSTSPASNVVQVDNGNVNTVSLASPPNTQDVSRIFVYRAATGSAGTQYLQVINPGSKDGGFELAKVTGTANVLVLATQDGAGTAVGEAVFFTPTLTNLGAVTANIDGTGARAVVDSLGQPLTAGDLLATVPYTLYDGAVAYAAYDAAAGQNLINLALRTTILVGDTATDPQGAIPPGTTVVGVTNNSVQLSNNLNAAISVRTQLRFSGGTYRLLQNYTAVDDTPTASLGNALISADFDPPVDSLQGIVSLPNGILAGFSGNTLYLSAQNHPQAWPLNYALATDSNIVGIAAIDNTVLILTDAHPYTAYGPTPEAFTMTREEFIQGCVSKRSISYLRGLGIIYASTDGIYAYSGLGQLRSLTEGLFTRKEWEPLNPSSIIGVVHQGLYFFWFKRLDGTSGGYMLDPSPQGFGLVEMDVHAIAVALNTTDDSLFMVIDHGAIAGNITPATNELVQWDAATTKRPYTWMSKTWQLKYPTAWMLYRLRAADYVNLDVKLFEQGVQYADLKPGSRYEAPVPALEVEDFSFQISGTSSAQPIQFVEAAKELVA